MSILVKGIEMPTDGNGIFIDWQGNVSMIGNEIKDVPTAHAVEVPPHGDLIDRDVLLQRAVPHGWSTPKWVSDIVINDAPTIISAEESER